MSFYQRFEKDILDGQKTITIRDAKSEAYNVDDTVHARIHEDGRVFAELKIQSIKPVLLNELNKDHARQENMGLSELKQVIKEIYPDVDRLFVISFKVVG